MLDSLDEPALLVGENHVVAANSAARALFGDVEGNDVRLVLRHPLALARLASGDKGVIELRGIGSAEREWRVYVAPLVGALFLVRLEDLSAARGAERMRTDFVANASHELRTPLATVVGYAETLAEEGPLDEARRRDFAATIETEGRRMLRLVEELMSLSRISADRFNPPTETVDLVAIVREAIEAEAQLARRRGATLGFECTERSIKVLGDKGQLAQLVANIVGNALAHGCTRGDTRVTIRLSRDRSAARLVVADQGAGIAAEHLPRLTERFYRVDAARSRDSGGTGLGLAIVKHIVERHRGTLLVRSQPGEGTEVEVVLPTVTKL